MKSVYKYDIGADYFSVYLPEGAEILTVQMQNDTPQMWALVDNNKPYTHRHFRLAGTGHPIEDNIVTYIGTFQLYGGSLVFHLFEINNG